MYSEDELHSMISLKSNSVIINYQPNFEKLPFLKILKAVGNEKVVIVGPFPLFPEVDLSAGLWWCFFSRLKLQTLGVKFSSVVLFFESAQLGNSLMTLSTIRNKTSSFKSYQRAFWNLSQNSTLILLWFVITLCACVIWCI